MEPMEAACLREVPTLSLAYMGDAVYEQLVREYILHQGISRVASLHKAAVHFVSADAQSGAGRFLLPRLTEQEADIYRRGRNAKPHSIPRNTSHGAYSHATALETLFGWLYLSGQKARIDELWIAVLEYFDANNR